MNAAAVGCQATLDWCLLAWATPMTCFRITGWLITSFSNCLASGLAAVFSVSSATLNSTAAMVAGHYCCWWWWCWCWWSGGAPAQRLGPLPPTAAALAGCCLLLLLQCLVPLAAVKGGTRRPVCCPGHRLQRTRPAPAALVTLGGSAASGGLPPAGE